MVGAHRAATAPNAGNAVAGAYELCSAQGEKITELGVWTMVHQPIGFHGNYFTVLVRAVLELNEKGRALAGIGDVLVVVVSEENRTAGRHSGGPDQSFHGGTELVAEGASGGVLHKTQLLGFYSEAGGDHGVMEVDAYALRVNCKPSFVIEIGKTYVGLHGQMGLPLEVEFVFYDVGGRIHERFCIAALCDLLLVVDVGGPGMDLDGVIGHSGRRAHVGWKLFELNHDLFGRGPGVLHRVGADNGDGVAELEHLSVAQDGTVPAVALVRREGDEARYAVFALYILMGHHLVDAGHLFGCGGVDGDDVGMGNLRLHQGKLQGIRRKLEPQIRTVVAGSGHFGQSARTRVFSTPDPSVGRELVGQLLLGDLAAQDPRPIHDGIHQGL